MLRQPRQRNAVRKAHWPSDKGKQTPQPKRGYGQSHLVCERHVDLKVEKVVMLVVLVKCGAPHGALQKETSYLDGRKLNGHEFTIPPVERYAEGRYDDVTTMVRAECGIHYLNMQGRDHQDSRLI
jgi:hypothetical protein